MHQLHIYVYILNLALLFAHEIESAYWKEWELFRIPGGVQLFVLLHIPLLMAALVGLVLLREAERSGVIISMVLAAAGVFAFSIHTFFILRGRREFTLPVSLFLLAAILAASLAQGYFAVMELSA